jgi:hypothetical protein
MDQPIEEFEVKVNSLEEQLKIAQEIQEEEEMLNRSSLIPRTTEEIYIEEDPKKALEMLLVADKFPQNERQAYFKRFVSIVQEAKDTEHIEFIN